MSLNIQKKLVGVTGASPDNGHQLLLTALAELYPVEFRRIVPSGYHGLDALVVLDGDLAKGLAAAADGLPSLVAGEQPGAPQVVVPGEVRFGASEVLDDYLRKQVMAGGGSRRPSVLTVQPGDEIVASMSGQPVWLARPWGKGVCQIAGASLPLVREKELLFQHFHEDRFLQLLPLMNFLRQLVKDIEWRSASLPACFVVDDPSLYRPSYGHLNFRRLAEHATKDNFFVSVATIPLDTWWVNRGVVETFRSFSPRLSVLIHGNNHTAREMLPKDGAGCLAVAAQALRRVERLQQRHQLEVFKIMEPPHGALADRVFPHLLALGYEATLGETKLLARHNPAAAWPAGFGLDRSQILGGGMPLIPRFKMSPHWRNGVLLAAFLRQPIVIVLHHEDVADGYEPLVEVARMINQLNGVTWTSPLGIARSNYTELRREDELNIKAYSRRILLAIPPGIKSLSIRRPWLQGGGTEELVMRNSGREIFRAAGSGILGPIPLESPCELEVYSPPTNPIDHRTVRVPRFRCWPVARKVLMEARDRSAPWRYRVTKLWRSPAAKLLGTMANIDLCPTQSHKR
jgi:hypothetical protein